MAIDTTLSSTSSNMLQNKVITAALNEKITKLETDNVPTENSDNQILSGSLYSVIANDVTTPLNTKKVALVNAIVAKGGTATVDNTLDELITIMVSMIGGSGGGSYPIVDVSVSYVGAWAAYEGNVDNVIEYTTPNTLTDTTYQDYATAVGLEYTDDVSSVTSDYTLCGLIYLNGHTEAGLAYCKNGNNYYLLPYENGATLSGEQYLTGGYKYYTVVNSYGFVYFVDVGSSPIYGAGYYINTSNNSTVFRAISSKRMGIPDSTSTTGFDGAFFGSYATFVNDSNICEYCKMLVAGYGYTNLYSTFNMFTTTDTNTQILNFGGSLSIITKGGE